MDLRISQGIEGKEDKTFLLPDPIINDFITEAVERCERGHIGFPNIVVDKESNKTYAECKSDFDASTLYRICKKLKMAHSLLVEYSSIFDENGMFQLKYFDPWRVDYDNPVELTLMETMFDYELENLDEGFRDFVFNETQFKSFSEGSDIMKLKHGSTLVSKREAHNAAVVFR
ncbi:hypothetical protein VCHA53O466_140197 [Vibrio chagasii]|nr:hypothetical protein VCHA53O466_140197 [Vibrio chagasii]